MKKKLVAKLLSFALAAVMVGTMFSSNVYSVSAEETSAETEVEANAEVSAQAEAVLEDGINDAWTQDEANMIGTDAEDAICAVEDGWLHLKGGTGSNRNNPGTSPTIFVNPNTFDFDQAGYFEFTLKANNENTTSTNSDRFGVYLGYNTDKNGMFFGYHNGGWYWQKYTNGNGDWSDSFASAPAKGQEISVRIDWTADKKASIAINGEVLVKDTDFSGITDTLGDKIAIKAGSWGNVPTDVLLKNIHYTGQAEAATYTVTGKVTDADGKPLEGATVNMSGETVKTDADGTYSFDVIAGTYGISASMAGYDVAETTVTVEDAAVEAEDIVLNKLSEVETEVLSTDMMDVYVAKNFPSVVKYEMKGGELEGKIFYGQTSEINTVRINGTDVQLSPEDVKATFADDRAEYTLTVKGEAIDAVIKAELVAEENTLAFNITEIKNNLSDTVDGQPIQRIEIPNHSLISVRSDQEGANLKGAAMSQNTRISGDEYIEVNDSTKAGNRDYMYAFISNSELSAGLWSNSEHEGRTVSVVATGGSANTRVMSTAEQKDGVTSMGLASCEWYYHRVITDSKGNNYLVTETEMPQTKIIITGDQNDDNQIDWQDGAVAFRSIMNNPYKSEEVPELVAYRIAMNFGGQAQNPFLTTLDNVKRVALHTDGLGQSVLLKGYANEGHDSGHPDYADIGERIGGAEDMNTLMTKGAEYGARFGIHVNAGEMYPEAKAFSDDLVRRNADGSLRYGWNWIDQGIGIDSIYDLAMGLREARFDALEEKVGQNLDFVYVDIWGNNTGSTLDDSWQTRKLSKEINDNGWRMANEWGCANEYDSTFQHWATDLTYGGYSSQGENSEVMRFLRNHQKDSWIGDYPSYGGAAMMPLLGGYNMKDFEGWQGRNDYDTYITNLYTHDVTTKFIQHYEIVKWVDGDPVTAGAATNWVPEMEITLKDDDGNTLVITRGSNDPNDAAYRERTMTLNGKVISQGAPSRGDRSDSDIQNGRNKGTESYLLPWIWDSQTGEKVASAEEKLYHWNTQGGTTTWELPDSWSGLKNVKVYKLTDLGKTDEQSVEVKDGKITLTAESEIPYVVCKGEESNIEITWSEGMHIVDAGFNSGNFDAWDQTGDGSAEIAKSQYSNPMMKLSGEIAMTQEMTDLTPGKQYAVLVGVDNRSDAKAIMTVKSGDTVLGSNYTERSIAKNYVKAYTHSTSSATVDGNSYFQNMYVFFTVPESGKVTLTLSREAGDGDTYFDDVRIVENESNNITTNENGEVVKFEQDFETNVQGIYPFVIGGIEGVEDNRTHLSELHAPYTQAGWDVKKMNDVLDGNWSVKINGLTQRNALAFQTIPQNFRFEPGKKYKVSFDYESGSDDIYAFAYGAGEYQGTPNLITLKMALGEKAHFEAEVIGDLSGQTWVGIYSTSTAADPQGTTGSATNFGGYQDFVLDNLVIEKVDETITAEDLQALIEEAGQYSKDDGYTVEQWTILDDAVTDARVALDKDQPVQTEIEDAYYALRGALMMISAVNVKANTDYDIPVDGVIVTAGNEDLGGSFGGSEGPKEYVIDGDTSTAWVTTWGDYATCIENGEGWIDLEYPEPHTVDGFRYLPSQSNQGQSVFHAITSYELWVKTTDSEEYQMVASGDWDYDKEWKIISFDPVENVTNVKLVATEVLAANWWATAAEIRATSTVEAVIPEITVDKSGLQQAIDAAKGLDPEKYTEETWAVVADRLAAAEEVLNDENAAKYDVLLAIANLTDAIGGLEAASPVIPEEVDKTTLNGLIAQYAGLSKDKYTEDSWKVFEAAYDRALEVAADEDAVQADVDAAAAALTSAYAGLEEVTTPEPEPSKADTSKLDKFYNECLAYYKEANHSKANWKKYQEALKAAKAVLDNEDATQEEVDNALAKLLEITAKMNAELKNSSDAPKNPSTNKPNAVKTGDTAMPIAWAMIGFIAMLAAVLVFLKRRRRA